MREPASVTQQLLECKAILDHSGIAVVCLCNRHVYRCDPHAEGFGWATGALVGQPDVVFYASSDACLSSGSTWALAGWPDRRS